MLAMAIQYIAPTNPAAPMLNIYINLLRKMAKLTGEDLGFLKREGGGALGVLTQ